MIKREKQNKERTMKQRFYSAESDHGTESSRGFANDTTVMVFDSKAARDRYVEESRNISCEAIKRNEVTREAANLSLTDNRVRKPNTFNGEFWGIVDMCDMIGWEKPDGYIGQVDVCNSDEAPGFVERLNR